MPRLRCGEVEGETDRGRAKRKYPGLVNPGVDGILRALEPMGATEDAALRQADEGGRA